MLALLPMQYYFDIRVVYRLAVYMIFSMLKCFLLLFEFVCFYGNTDIICLVLRVIVSNYV